MDDEDIIKLKLDQERQEYLAQVEAVEEEGKSDKDKPQKMGFIFFFVALFLSIIGDVVDFFTGGTIGWFVGLFIDAILALMFGLSKSGRKQFKRMLVAFIGESIPIIGMLPFRTIFCIWSFMKSRSKVVEEVSSVAGKVL